MSVRWLVAVVASVSTACAVQGGAPANTIGENSSRGGAAAEGRRLFLQNCAHCHGDDARGDEGPSLYDLRKSDERINRLVREGIKGEMPAFKNKLNEANVAALIAFLRTLKE
jgi:cytochrome c oxidase cbb3-type subunit 3